MWRRRVFREGTQGGLQPGFAGPPGSGRNPAAVFPRDLSMLSGHGDPLEMERKPGRILGTSMDKLPALNKPEAAQAPSCRLLLSRLFRRAPLSARARTFWASRPFCLPGLPGFRSILLKFCHQIFTDQRLIGIVSAQFFIFIHGNAVRLQVPCIQILEAPSA